MRCLRQGGGVPRNRLLQFLKSRNVQSPAIGWSRNKYSNGVDGKGDGWRWRFNAAAKAKDAVIPARGHGRIEYPAGVGQKATGVHYWARIWIHESVHHVFGRRDGHSMKPGFNFPSPIVDAKTGRIVRYHVKRRNWPDSETAMWKFIDAACLRKCLKNTPPLLLQRLVDTYKDLGCCPKLEKGGTTLGSLKGELDEAGVKY